MKMFKIYSHFNGWRCRITQLERFHTNLSSKTLFQKIQTVSVASKGEDGFIPFLERLNLKKAEAKRSLIVQVQSAQSYRELNAYCSLFGTVKQMFHYSTGVEPLHYILVEFQKESDVTNLLSHSSYVEDSLVVPAHSHFLWFRAPSNKSPKLKQNKSFTLSIQDGVRILTEDEIRHHLNKCENVSEQMIKLHMLTKLSDLGSRLRYITALQIEHMLSGIFPHVAVYPFGSSVNGYGKMACDLDLVVKLADKKNSEDSRLIYQCKASTGSERSSNQRHIEVFGDMINLFLPGCVQVRRILQARIPIIKYHQQLTDVECDLSMGNMSGVYMSDFLYLMGEIDDRVRPLIFTVRKWACAVGITNSSPGRWITNFSLTLLVLAFLQRPQSGKPIIPSLNTLVKLAGPSDEYITEDGINCTFLRDITKYKEKNTNTDSLETLLKQFFQYYSEFDFSSKAVCLNEAVALTKPEFSPLYIVNPLERGLNVSKNVSAEEVDHLKTEIRNALWILESQECPTGNWGLLSIFERKVKPQLYQSFFSKSRLMDVTALFEGEEDEQALDYKNDVVKKQVENIKKETKEKISKYQTITQHKNER